MNTPSAGTTNSIFVMQLIDLALQQPRHLSPVLDTFIRALPRTYLAIHSDEDTSVCVAITGEAGGRWSILREEQAWKLYTGAPDSPTAEVFLDQDIAWRLFTRGASIRMWRRRK